MKNTAQRKPREGETRRDWMPSCRHYSTCTRLERVQERCNARCCPGYKKPKK